ncbi:MAG: metallophosphoesterase [Candidatus Marinimicrobia bacterium]|nr:metallophosphoesterase [Candidatus Neomarinimicrobiota bacterium]
MPKTKTSPNPPPIRIVFMADTHLGFDSPIHPRIQRRRRGDDFFMNFQRILDYAIDHKVDLVVHGGDLFFRARIPKPIVDQVYTQLREFSQSGIPMLIVPGNHEFSRLPEPHRIDQQNIYLFETPGTFQFQIRGTRIAIGGFPFHRKNIRDRFSELVYETDVLKSIADIRLLVIHQAVEGAQVGKSNYTFRSGEDVVRGRDIPSGVHAVLAGHIHRQQILTFPQKTGPSVPVIYSGSIERTSFAERDEQKGFYVIEFSKTGERWGLSNAEFHPLPVRPMVDIKLDLSSLTPENLDSKLPELLKNLDPHAVVRISCKVVPELWLRKKLTAEYLRSISSPMMNISIGSSFLPSRQYDKGQKTRLKNQIRLTFIK